MTMLLCDPATDADVRSRDDASAGARAWLAKQLLFEQLLQRWRADDESE